MPPARCQQSVRFLLFAALSAVAQILWCVPSLASQQNALQRIASPYGSATWLLQYLIALALGLGFLVLLNQLISRHGNLEVSGSLAKEAAQLRRLVIGYPDGMTIFEKLRATHLLEHRFEPLGLAVDWQQYPSASSLLNDLGQGLIQFSGGGGSASIFSQAANHFFVRVAREKYPELNAEAILVPEDSPIRQLADLRGKRIAFDEGSSAHYVLIRALLAAGIPYGDIEPIMLPQQDALPLFIAGRIDAWVVWMPYASNHQRRNYPGRSIGNLSTILGESVLDEVPTLYYATPELVRDYPRILKAILEEVNEAGVLVSQHRLEDALRCSGPGEDLASRETLRRRSLERALLPLDDSTLAGLQVQANLFHQLGLIRERVNVRDTTHTLRMRQNWSY